MLGTNCEQTGGAPQAADATPTSRTYTWTDVTPATAVVETVADATGCDPLDLDPLHQSVDADALNAVTTDDGRTTDLGVSFSYHGFRVVVSQTGAITLYDATSDRRAAASRPAPSDDATRSVATPCEPSTPHSVSRWPKPSTPR
jgi:hypothetical protein